MTSSSACATNFFLHPPHATLKLLYLRAQKGCIVRPGPLAQKARQPAGTSVFPIINPVSSSIVAGYACCLVITHQEVAESARGRHGSTNLSLRPVSVLNGKMLLVLLQVQLPPPSGWKTSLSFWGPVNLLGGGC